MYIEYKFFLGNLIEKEICNKEIEFEYLIKSIMYKNYIYFFSFDNGCF